MTLRDDLLRLFPRLRDLPTHAYVVGGAVRDLTLGAAPADVDVACLDPLVCARALRRKVIRLGREEHLSAYRVVDGLHIYDFAALLDGSIDADLARRDFTINAMAVDLESGELLDPHNGRADLGRRVVRMIDAANFDDDPLRMLKAIRMTVRFDFEVDAETLDAIRVRAPRIADVAVERVAYELTVIFSANAFRRAVTLLRETRLDVPLFGRSLDTDFHADDVPLAAALALLVDDAHAFAKRWRLSDALMREIQTLQRLIESHALLDLYDAGEPIARQLPPMLRALGRDDRVTFPDFAIKPLLTGDEIAQIAEIEAGPRIGMLKRALLEQELEGRVTSREAAEEFVKKF
ncbi:MAG: CCA tRNA nucleotidyltransferase [Acidobacteria bacterium]|nr:CCA tRNA nucleotidyltransferase [Acidobacteriota bacterium]MBV9188503.1 CCA tRNA nucleotidyltransferase [Acidobacteriota bacterium]